jgi:hypothetical protein
MSIFPTIGYSFIGIAIAFLATGVFMMYFIRVIEPRSADRPVLRHSWEFTVPPLLLVMALGFAPFELSISAGTWLPWAAFMLMSSLALACGLVFHGIFKDARMARDRVKKIERQLHRLTGVPFDEEESLISDARRRLLRLIQQIRDGRVQHETADGAQTDGEPNVSTFLVPPYRGVDMIVAPEVVIAIEHHRLTLRRVEDDLREIQAAISQLEQQVAPETLRRLRERQHLLRGMNSALLSHQDERRCHVQVDHEILLLKIAVTERATQTVGPLIKSVREATSPFADEGGVQ